MPSSFNPLTMTWTDATALLAVNALGPLCVIQTYLPLLRRSQLPRAITIGSNTSSHTIANSSQLSSVSLLVRASPRRPCYISVWRSAVRCRMWSSCSCILAGWPQTAATRWVRRHCPCMTAVRVCDTPQQHAHLPIQASTGTSTETRCRYEVKREQRRVSVWICSMPTKGEC